MIMNCLFIIPARGGSKGIPKKNIKKLNGKPLIQYSIDVARALTTDNNICVSTDDIEIFNIVEDYGLNVPFIRPAELATDTTGSYEVLIHALNYYESLGRQFDVIVLLQPTSPLRTSEEVKDAISLFEKELDMVVSVRESHSASVICLENEFGYLELPLAKHATRRQEIINYYEYNGAIYVINIECLREKHLREFNKIKKYIMCQEHSIDIDTKLDWLLAESILTTI